jgi:beta-phosphoglucomutase-like phosphatase (HAD superfamily)
MTTEAIVFDLDGVLVDSEHVWDTCASNLRVNMAGAGTTVHRRT